MSASGYNSFAFSPQDVIRCRTMGDGRHQVVFLHGFAASQHTWDDLLPFFSADRFTLHLLDLKGHGGSSRPGGGDYSPSHNASIVKGYIHAKLLQDVTIIGHSLGGAVALLTAMACPEVRRLILIGAPAYPQELPIYMDRLQLPFIGPLTMALTPRRVIARLGLQSVFFRHERITPRLIDRYASCYGGLSRACALARSVRQIVPHDFEGIIGNYGKILIPVLLLWGEHDRVVPLWQGERLRRELGNARLAVIQDAGHNPHEELPETAFALMAEFLEGHVDKQTPQ